MGLNAKEASGGGGGGFRQPPLEAGTYPARLVQVIDLGVQRQPDFKGQPKDPIQMIYTTYEILDEFCVNEEGETLEDKPRWISEDFGFYNLDTERATSTKRYLGLDPNQDHDGDWTALIGVAANVNITHTPGKGKHAGKVFNNIAGVSPMRKKEADNAPDLKNPSKVFLLDDPDIDVFMALPKWLQDKIKDNLDYEGSDLEDAVRNYKAPEDDDVEDEKPKKEVKKKQPADEDNEDDW